MFYDKKGESINPYGFIVNEEQLRLLQLLVQKSAFPRIANYYGINLKDKKNVKFVCIVGEDFMKSMAHHVTSFPYNKKKGNSYTFCKGLNGFVEKRKTDDEPIHVLQNESFVPIEDMTNKFFDLMPSKKKMEFINEANKMEKITHG